MLVEIVVAFAVVAFTVLIFLVLFEPGLPYRVVTGSDRPKPEDSPRLVAALVGAELQYADTVEILTDGEAFYASELAAIRQSQTSVHLELFIFHRSRIGGQFLAALIECAQRGVAVRVVIDAIGSLPTPESYFAPLRAAGGRVVRYQPIRWYTLKRFNNRSHRDLIIIDGTIGFIGGAGIAGHWSESHRGNPPWRDTMTRITGSAVTGLQSAFIENWLEASGEILAVPDSFPSLPSGPNAIPAVVIAGTPSPARASRARLLYQLGMSAATRSIEITSPYFLPDRAARRELRSAVARGVQVRVIVPGKHNNHPSARLSSRRKYGELLAAGVEIFEYQPGMIHAKLLVLDGRYAIVGSTNFDRRSFELNDEVNVVLFDAGVAERLGRDFERDRERSHQVTIDDWRRRSLLERTLAIISLVFQRQE